MNILQIPQCFSPLRIYSSSDKPENPSHDKLKITWTTKATTYKLWYTAKNINGITSSLFEHICDKSICYGGRMTYHTNHNMASSQYEYVCDKPKHYYERMIYYRHHSGRASHLYGNVCEQLSCHFDRRICHRCRNDMVSLWYEYVCD